MTTSRELFGNNHYKFSGASIPGATAVASAAMVEVVVFAADATMAASVSAARATGGINGGDGSVDHDEYMLFFVEGQN
jgi:hypothetical protein